MLTQQKLDIFKSLTKNASKEELIWMQGFITGLLQHNSAGSETLIAGDASQSSLMGCTVVYGTETGNSKKVATDFSSRLKKQGIQSKMKSLDQYRVADLTKESCLVVVMSTQGDGEPPAAAKKFYDYLQENNPALNNLKYGVLALGDSAYPLYCKAGEDVDMRLQQLGASRIAPLGKCDSDFEDEANEWINDLITNAIHSPAGAAQKPVVNTKPGKPGKKFYEGTVITHINLNDTGSAKETYHIEIATEDAIVYEPGDSIGIVAENNRLSVQKIIELVELEPAQTLHYKDTSYTAEELFRTKINIQYMPERIIQQYARLVKKDIPSIRMDLIDLLRIYPSDETININQLLAILEPVTPRLYSISSSPAAHGDSEVHITVSRSNFMIDGHQRFGLCSDYLSCLPVNTRLQLYVQKNNAFRLPDADADVIMIGPGTGVAPFRSFLLERDAQCATGRNWLFFGDQHFVTDFLYQTELQTLLETGVLTKINTAFSRDQKEKLYVQHRMLQHAEELHAWMQNGAHIYICGTKEPMSIDVENTLKHIIASQQNIGEEAATMQLDALHEAGRYHKDVY